MLMNLAGYGLAALLAGTLLIMRGVRKGCVESASVGGLLSGAGTMILAFQYFYIFQHDDEGGGYFGTPVSETLLGAFLMVGFALILVSLYGWLRHRLFWQYFMSGRRTQRTQEKS